MKKRLARSFSGSVIEAEASIRQNMTAWVVGLRDALEAVVVQIDGIDVGDGAAQPLLVLEPALAAPRSLRLVRRGFGLGGRQLLLEPLDLGLRSAAAAPCAGRGSCAWCGVRLSRAGGPSVVKPARAVLRRLEVLELDLDQVRQLQIVEEQVEEFFLGQREGEIVLALAVGAALAAAATAAALAASGSRRRPCTPRCPAARSRAGPSCGPKTEGRLAQALGADRDLLGALGLRDLARSCSESLMASRISALARRRKRWRLPRLLDFGLRRRSTICMCLLRWCLRGTGVRDAQGSGGSRLPPPA